MKVNLHTKSSLRSYITQVSLKTTLEETPMKLISFRSHARTDGFLSVTQTHRKENDESSVEKLVLFICCELSRSTDPTKVPREIG